MKITIFIPQVLHFPLVEGVQKQAFLTAKALRKHFDIEIVCFKENYFLPGTQIEQKEDISIKKVGLYYRIKTDVLHLFGSPTPLMIPVLSMSKYSKLAISFFDGEISKYWLSRPSRVCAKILIKNHAKAIVQTDYQTKIARQNGFDTTVIPPLLSEFKRSAKKSKMPSLLFMTHLSKVKGIDIVLSAFREIQQKTKIELVIADSGYWKTDYSEKLKNEPGVILKGIVDPEKELSLAWIYLYPVLEACNTFSVPLSFFESEAVGTPFIASNVGGMSEYFSKEALVEPGNVTELVKKINLFIKRPSTKLIKQKINNADTIRKIMKVYKN